MKWETPLLEGTILNRYKRFLSDVELPSGVEIVHVPNTGSMTSCWDKNWKCAVSRSSNPKRKLSCTLELTHNGQTWIGVNTGNANKLAKEAFENGIIQEFKDYTAITPEKKWKESRFDFFLESTLNQKSAFIEVKSVTLKKDGVAQFPDSVSKRGQKHLRDLMEIRKSGVRAAILFIIQREDVDAFYPAWECDPEYARLLKCAEESGVEILVYQCKINLEGMRVHRKVPYTL